MLKNTKPTLKPQPGDHEIKSSDASTGHIFWQICLSNVIPRREHQQVYYGVQFPSREHCSGLPCYRKRHISHSIVIVPPHQGQGSDDTWSYLHQPALFLVHIQPGFDHFLVVLLCSGEGHSAFSWVLEVQIHNFPRFTTTLLWPCIHFLPLSCLVAL